MPIPSFASITLWPGSLSAACSCLNPWRIPSKRYPTPPSMARNASPKNGSANLGFETKLWLAADKLRNNMDAAEYKHVVLGLIFLKYISDTFEEHRAKLLAGEGLSACDAQADDYAGANPEDQDEYKAENVFWVPKEARWSHLQANARQPTIGKLVDDAMVAIERDNPRLKGVLPKDYARPALDKHRLGELIDLIATITLTCSGGLRPPEEAAEAEESATVTDRRHSTHRSVDLLGRVYEYFLGRFASAEGKPGGEFYTPQCVDRLLVEMIAPYKGRIYDPYHDYLRQHGHQPWDKNSQQALYVRQLGRKDDLAYEDFREFIETRPAETVSNILICLIHQTNYLLDRQLKRLEQDFLKEGGLRERMTRARLAARARHQRGGPHDT